MILGEIVKYNNFELRFPLLSLNTIIWGMYGGILLACLLGLYCKKYEGEAVRRLLKRGANTADNALTLSELGLKPSALRLHANGANDAEGAENAADKIPAEDAPLVAVALPADLKKRPALYTGGSRRQGVLPI